MPCLGEAWNEALTPGTPEYIQEEKKVRAHLDALLHVIDYYCGIHRRTIPIENCNSGTDFDNLPSPDRRLLADIYHHLRCDGVNASVAFDVLALVESDEQKHEDLIAVIKVCYRLLRSGAQIMRDDSWR